MSEQELKKAEKEVAQVDRETVRMLVLSLYDESFQDCVEEFTQDTENKTKVLRVYF